MKMLIPNLILESIFAIDLEALKQRQISGLLIDIDNTLVPWGESQMQDSFIAWVQEAKELGFKLCLVSNALETRAQNFAKLLDIPAVGRAFKPLNRAFVRGLDLLNLPPSQVAVIGDQLFTDVFGGNRLGLYTILINPLSTEELGTTKLIRKLEQKILEKMVKRGQVSTRSMRIRKGRE